MDEMLKVDKKKNPYCHCRGRSSRNIVQLINYARYRPITFLVATPFNKHCFVETFHHEITNVLHGLRGVLYYNTIIPPPLPFVALRQVAVPLNQPKSKGYQAAKLHD